MQPSRSQVTERNGLFELEAGTDVLDSPRYNHDMAPTKVHERTWNKWHITALWIGMSICVPTYTLGGVLTAYFGLSVGEALLAILLANLVVLIPLTFRHHWFQRSVPDSRPGGVWLVRHSNPVRRPGHSPVSGVGI